jgi:dTDP-4-dehydrorhamnose reductase
MKILVTGAGGQLGQELVRKFGHGKFEVIPVTKLQMNIANRTEVKRIINHYKPAWVVNCAAYTNVDLAEHNVDKSHEVNTLGPEILAQACKVTGTKILHISTNAVFSSEKPVFFKGNSEPNPVNQYGRSKLGGERILLKSHHDNSWIIRTSWLYGEFGGKFVNNVLGALNKNLPLQIVDDQFGQPTNSKNLAEHIEKFLFEPPVENVYHFADDGFTSRYDFVSEIVKYLNISQTKISRIATSINFDTAVRPKYSLLSLCSESVAFNTEFLPWQKSLYQYLKVKKLIN